MSGVEKHDAHWHERKATALVWLRARSIEEGECLVWTGATGAGGYPIAYVGGVSGAMVRRWAYECCRGRLPSWRKSGVSSSCENKLCVNPAHLVLRRKSDAVKKGWEQSAARTAGYGVRLAGRIRGGLVKLDMETAREIRRDERASAVVAAEHGVCLSTVQKIRQGVSWREAAPGASVFSWGGLAA